MQAALVIHLANVKKDPALQPGARGARKLLVTGIYAELEQPACQTVWSPPATTEKCQVQVTPDIELAVFTEQNAQDRHFHKVASEFYTVLKGEMVIEVEDHSYLLSAGDTIVINPGTVHQIKPEGCEFICQVLTANCSGIADKYIR
jgi:mannose-6-phosphate isomerase-like protein (cupin superfamily)